MPFGWIRSIFSNEPMTSPYAGLSFLSQRLRARYPNLNVDLRVFIDPLGLENIRMELGPHGNRFICPLSSLDYSCVVSQVEQYLEHNYVMDFEQASNFVSNYFIHPLYADIRPSEHSYGYDIAVRNFGVGYFTTYLPAAQMTRSNIRSQLRGGEFQLTGQGSPIISTASNPQSYEYGSWYREGVDMVVQTQIPIHSMSRDYLPRGFDYGGITPIRSDGFVSGRHQYRVRVVGWTSRVTPMPKYKNKKRGLAGGLP